MIPRVLLVGHSFRSANLGVGALSIGSTALLAHAAQNAGVDIEVDTYGSSGRLDYRDESEVPIRSELWLSRRELAKELPRRALWSDYGLILDASEGDSFASIYGRSRFTDQLLMKITGVLSKPKYVLLPQTLGPFNRTNGALAWAVVRRADATFARDTRSAEAFSRSILSTDVAFAARVVEPTKRPPQSFGLNVSGLLYNGAFGDDGFTRHYRAFVRDLIGRLKAEGREITLVPHVLGDVGDGDTSVSNELADEFGLEVIHCQSPLEVKREISRFAAFVGSRMHAVIAAVSTATPAVAVAYSIKFAPLLNALGYSGVVTLDTRLTASDVLRQFENPATLQEQAAVSSESAESRLAIYRDYLSELLSGDGS